MSVSTNRRVRGEKSSTLAGSYAVAAWLAVPNNPSISNDNDRSTQPPRCARDNTTRTRVSFRDEYSQPFPCRRVVRAAVSRSFVRGHATLGAREGACLVRRAALAGG